MLAFTVYGVPAPKGSAKAFMPKGRRFPVVTHDNPRTKPWQESVVSAARDALQGGAPVEGPVGVVMGFFLPRPPSLPKRIMRPIRSRGSDLDKLVRCVLDGLTRAGVYRDDAQVVCTIASKNFAGGGDDPMLHRGIPRVEIHVQDLAEAPHWENFLHARMRAGQGPGCIPPAPTSGTPTRDSKSEWIPGLTPDAPQGKPVVVPTP